MDERGNHGSHFGAIVGYLQTILFLSRVPRIRVVSVLDFALEE